MVLTPSFSSIKGFVASRPPLVLFTLCLIAFAATTFTFAYYVEHRSDLPNIDAHRDWVSFLSYLSKRKLCLTANDVVPVVTSTVNQSDNETGDIIAVSVTATLSSNVSFQNATGVQGYIYTQDWVSECALSTPVDRVKIFYNVPHNTNSTVSDIDVCVSIWGPRELLFPASSDNRCSNHGNLHAAWGILDKNLSPSVEPCVEGVPMVLTYKPSPQNRVLLTMHDRSIINLHLFHTSYFLLVMAITLICYAMIKGKPTVKHQPLDKLSMEA